MTGGTGLTYGCTAPATGYPQVACYEVPASGGTIAVDSSTPASASGASGSTVKSVTSASFNPPVGSVVAVAFACDSGSGSAGYSVISGITDTSGLGLTWTLRAGGTDAGHGIAAVYTAAIPSTTVSGAATLSGSGSMTAAGAEEGAATLSGTGTMTGAGALEGAAALSGSGSMTATGTSEGASLSGSGSMTAAVTGTWEYAGGLSGTGTMTSAYSGTFQQAAGLPGRDSSAWP